jgi:hypothetical protein
MENIKFEINTILKTDKSLDITEQKKEIYNKLHNLNHEKTLLCKSEILNKLATKVLDKNTPLEEKQIFTFALKNYQKPFSELDFDNDGLTNAEEISLGLSIYSKDTNGNGISDINDTDFNLKLPQGTHFRINKKENEDTFFIQKKHKVLGWKNLKPNKLNPNTSFKKLNSALIAYKEIQTNEINKSKKNFRKIN